MDRQQIKDWIIDNLKGKNYNLQANQATDINATWALGKIKAPDGKNYDACIIYLVNNKRHARFVTTEVYLEDSINFSNHQNKPTWNQNKLNQLVNETEQNLKNGGDYKLELVGNTGFKITTL